jgi:hypothetical protein
MVSVPVRPSRIAYVRTKHTARRRCIIWSVCLCDAHRGSNKTAEEDDKTMGCDGAVVLNSLVQRCLQNNV